MRNLERDSPNKVKQKRNVHGEDKTYIFALIHFGNIALVTMFLRNSATILNVSK